MPRLRTLRAWPAFLAVCVVVSGDPTSAQIVPDDEISTHVVPDIYEAAPGPTANRLPFSADAGLYLYEYLARFQQVYDASSLTPLLWRDVVGVAFRAEEYREGDDRGRDVAGGFLYTDLAVRLSTTPTPVDSLALDLDENFGAVVTLVYDGPYTLPDLESEPSPTPFDLVIYFSSPYRYRGGNLLLDIEMPEQVPDFFYLDAVYDSPDEVSRAYLRGSGIPGSDTLGLITQFIVAPEPSAGLLAAAALASLAARRRSDRGTTRPRSSRP